MKRSSRKNKMNTAKLGVMFIVAAMALAGIGAGYSAWFDTIYVEGTVGTGSVEWEVVDYSGTYVWKIHGLEEPTQWGGEIYVDYDHVNLADSQDYVQNTLYPSYTIELVSSAVAMDGDSEYDVSVAFKNLFPCIWFKADIVIEYTGTVPGKINDIYYDVTDGIDWITPLLASGDIYATARVGDEVVELGYQLHQGDQIHIELNIHIPQNNALMLQEAAFVASFEVVQWNEYPYSGGGCGDEPNIGHHADVMLTLDTSGSITGYEAQLQTAAKAFVTAILSPDDGQIGIVSFADTATLQSTFSTDETALHTIIDTLVFGGLTNLEHGIQLSQNELETADRTPDSDYPDYMVIITDGYPTAGGDPGDDADAAKAAGTRIFVLGVGIPDPTTLQSIASSPTDYYDVADWGDLEDVLLSIISI